MITMTDTSSSAHAEPVQRRFADAVLRTLEAFGGTAIDWISSYQYMELEFTVHMHDERRLRFSGDDDRDVRYFRNLVEALFWEKHDDFVVASIREHAASYADVEYDEAFDTSDVFSD